MSTTVICFILVFDQQGTPDSVIIYNIFYSLRISKFIKKSFVNLFSILINVLNFSYFVGFKSILLNFIQFQFIQLKAVLI